MSTLGFDRYVEPLKMYLAKYRGSVRGDRPELGGGGGGKKLAGGGSGSGVSLSMPGGGAGSLLGGVKKELSAQPKLDSLVGGPTDAPIFAYEATSGVMSMLPDYAPPSLAPGKNEVGLCFASCARIEISNYFCLLPHSLLLSSLPRRRCGSKASMPSLPRPPEWWASWCPPLRSRPTTWCRRPLGPPRSPDHRLCSRPRSRLRPQWLPCHQCKVYPAYSFHESS